MILMVLLYSDLESDWTIWGYIYANDNSTVEFYGDISLSAQPGSYFDSAPYFHYAYIPNCNIFNNREIRKIEKSKNRENRENTYLTVKIYFLQQWNYSMDNSSK